MDYIDLTYFKNNTIQLAQNEFTDPVLIGYVNRFEKQYLISAMGYDLYKNFTAGAGSIEKYTDIRDGKEFTVTDNEGREVLVKWNGLKNTEKISFLAYFTYYEYVRSTQTEDTTSGETERKTTNSKRASINAINRKLIDAYNDGIDLYGQDFATNLSYISLNLFNNPNSTKARRQLVQYNEEIRKGSLYNFIYHMNEKNGDDYYPNWNFTPLKKQNIFQL